LLVTGLIYFLYESEDDISLYLNEEYFAIEEPVKVEDDDLFIPATVILEELGFETSWDSTKRILSASLGNLIYEFPAENHEIIVNGETVKWNLPVKINDSVIYLPLFPLAETLGIFVVWDENSNTLYISTPHDYFDPLRNNSHEKPLLNVAYPPKDRFVYYGSSLFVFGTTQSFSPVEVMVNGELVEIFDPRTGNFLTMIDIPRGEEFPVLVEALGANGKTALERSVLYPAPWQAMPDKPLAIHSTLLIPGEDQVLRTGDVLRIAFQGSPGGEATFWIGDSINRFSMTELAYPSGPPGEGGIYVGSYTADEHLTSDNNTSGPMSITVSLVEDEEEVIQKLPGRVVFYSESHYKIVEVREEYKLKNRGWLYIMQDNAVQVSSGTLGGAGYSTSVVRYLVEGTRYETVGMSGNYYRVNLYGNENFLIHMDMVNVLEGKRVLEPVLSKVELTETVEKIMIVLNSSERFPFLVEDGKDRLEVEMYGLQADDNLILPDLTGQVRGLRLEPGSPEHPDSIKLIIESDYNMVGFKGRWNGNNLIIDIFKPPVVDAENPLKGKTIIIDPGHGGEDTGAIGPGDIHEKDVVLPMSLYLKEMLEEEGANVIMTRSEDVFVNLYDRPEQIDQYNADFFISVHVNAHAHNAPATEIHGLMTLYNYAHNEELADVMLKTMDELTGLPAFRTWRRNIAVIRHPHIPGVLVEAGYLMHPEDNWYILQPQGQKELAGAMKEGIKRYFLSYSIAPAD